MLINSKTIISFQHKPTVLCSKRRLSCASQSTGLLSLLPNPNLRADRSDGRERAFSATLARNQGRRPPRIAGPSPGTAIWLLLCHIVM